MSVNINNFDEPNKVNVTNTSNKITVVDLSKKENTVVTPSPLHVSHLPPSTLNEKYPLL